jgi:hypothetical protein
MAQRYQQGVGIESAPLQDEVILFLASSNRFCVLNRTCSFIWSELKQPATSDELARRLHSSFGGVSLQEAASGVDAALHQLLAMKLVVGADVGNRV